MFASLAPLEDAVQAGYLARLDVDAGPPSAEALQLIVRRQAERIPYETLWIQSGELWDIDPATAAQRLATTSRGGYCYHLNGALGMLLHSLGYQVHGHVGGVHSSDTPGSDEIGNHLVLTVTGLPTTANPEGIWYVDTGLGDALHEPVPLEPGTFRQHPFQLELERADDGAWHLRHDPAGGFRGMRWTLDPAQRSDFEAMHAWLSTSPDSGFVQVAMAERRDATGVDVIRGLVLSRVGDRAFTAGPVSDRREWFDLLADVFGLRFDDAPPGATDRLWATVLAAHRRWEAARDA